jgi:hypothetical protein
MSGVTVFRLGHVRLSRVAAAICAGVNTSGINISAKRVWENKGAVGPLERAVTNKAVTTEPS